MTLCKYRDALGQPGKGVHAWRIPPSGGPNSIAGTDLVLTVAAAALLNIFLSRNASFGRWTLNFVAVFVCLWVIGVLLHLLFCVNTPITRALFPKRVEQ